MSAFLGPIHYWLYRKIELQEELTTQLLILAKNKGIEDLEEKLDEKYGRLAHEPLEEMIDKHNIHGWLQQKVALVEYRLAATVTEMIKKDSLAIEEMARIFYEEGEKIGASYQQEEALTLVQVYKGITDSLLDGMPCDRVIQIINESEDKIIWTRNGCIHEQYWKAVGGDIVYYYRLREAWLIGFAYGTGTTFTKLDETTYQIERGITCTQ